MWRARAPRGARPTSSDGCERWFDAAKDFGVVTGYRGGTEVRAEHKTNRDTVALVLARIYDLPASNVDAFSDDDGTSMEPWHDKVAAAGLFTGYDDGHGCREFRGSHDATRDLIAIMARRAADRGLTPKWAQ